MKFLGKIAVTFLANAAALWIAARFVPGFTIAPGGKALAIAALLLTLIQIFIRPLVKLIFSPLIAVTLGIFIFIINAALLFILDKFSSSLTINGLTELLFATVIVSAVNILVHLAYRILKIIV